jgi:alanine dehydrogenase
MNTTDTLLLTRNDVASLLDIEECISAVENAFKMRAIGKANAPGILGIHADDGGFHIKAGILNLGKQYFVAKTNGNFPQNNNLHGLPTIQGVIIVSDASNGKVLALMDSIEITIIRTGAATGLAAKHLSRKDSKTAVIIGCGNQGRISLRALMKVRSLRNIYVHDIDSMAAKTFVDEMSKEFAISIQLTEDPAKAVRESQICVTCTPSRKYFLNRHDVRPGTFIAAVGSDSEDKQELDPALFLGNKVVPDSIDQCEKIGELHHALSAGTIKRNDIHAELGEVVAGIKPGRKNDDEIIIFDSTGTALQDVAAAAIVYEKAIQRGNCAKINFAA